MTADILPSPWKCWYTAVCDQQTEDHKMDREQLKLTADILPFPWKHLYIQN